MSLMPRRLVTLLLASLASLLTSVAFAASSTKAPPAAAKAAAEPAPIIRVGGDYTVASIDKLGERGFRIEFKAEHPSGKFDTLRLDSDHVHVAVKVGQKLRLSAEIMSQSGSTAEVAQVVLFFEGSQGRVPVWMLSSKAPVHDLRATKYLEMHVPQTDFQVL